MRSSKDMKKGISANLQAPCGQSNSSNKQQTQELPESGNTRASRKRAIASCANHVTDSLDFHYSLE